ncbi:phage portal protein, partial [Parabacteroides sp. OttesenSCG-928-J18]|nr:phage portal protein [Parabacteroides sp. OttesenSCG-928-J18]
MNIFNRLLNTISSEERSKQTIPLTNEKNTPVAGKLYSDLFSFNAANSLNNASVQRGINAISQAIASMKLYEYNLVNGEKIRTNSALDNLLNIAPNNQIDAFTFKQNIILNAFNNGNALIRINRDLNNNILGFDLMNPQFLNCQYNAIENIATYHYNGKQLDMSDYILFYIYPDKSFNNLFGQKFASYANETLKKTSYLDNYVSDWYNGGSVTGILSPKSQQRVLPPEQAAKAKQKFIAGAMDKGLIILDGEMEYTPISQSIINSGVDKMTELNIISIAQILNIPVSYLFANGEKIAEEEKLVFYQETLQP